MEFSVEWIFTLKPSIRRRTAEEVNRFFSTQRDLTPTLIQYYDPLVAVRPRMCFKPSHKHSTRGFNHDLRDNPDVTICYSVEAANRHIWHGTGPRYKSKEEEREEAEERERIRRQNNDEFIATKAERMKRKACLGCGNIGHFYANCPSRKSSVEESTKSGTNSEAHRIIGSNWAQYPNVVGVKKLLISDRKNNQIATFSNLSKAGFSLEL